MKTLALLLVLLLAGSSASFGDTGVLQNSDFADGINHWEGDCHTAGSASDDSGSTSGIVVKVRDGIWTKVSQDFDAKPGNYILTLTYTVMPGTTMSSRSDYYDAVNERMSLFGLGGLTTSPGKWVVIIRDTGVNYYNWWQITPTLDGTGVQTAKIKVNLHSSDSFKKGFFLGFPPGSGFVNLQSLSLVSADAPAAP